MARTSQARLAVSLLTLAALGAAGCAAQVKQEIRMPDEGWVFSSPGGLTAVHVRLFSPAGTADFPPQPRLYFRAATGGGDARSEMLSWSPLGITRKDEDFTDDLHFVAQKLRTLNEDYQLVAGKRGHFTSTGVECILSFETPRKARMDLVVRVFDDGFAFRYRFPEQTPGRFWVTGEATGFRLPSTAVAFLAPQYNPGFERAGIGDRDWMTDLPVGTPAPANAAWALPALFALSDGTHWALLAEVGLDGEYCASTLGGKADGGLYRLHFPHPDEHGGRGEAIPSSNLPWATPWRLVIMGDRLGTLVESSLATDLADPPAAAPGAWIRAGNEVWRAEGGGLTGMSYGQAARLLDWAALAGWQHLLVDAGWPSLGGGTWQDLARTAGAKSVSLVLGARDAVAVPAPDLAAAGLKGVRLYAPDSGKQEAIRPFLDAVEAAGKSRLTVEVEGRMPGAGWQRTWPNLIASSTWRNGQATMDGARRARLNVMEVFTGNVLGPLEPQPVGFNHPARRLPMTWGHMLGSAIVFESGRRHFADADGFVPRDAFPLVARLPAVWDEVRLVDGDPARLAVVARRKDRVWYVGGISADPAVRVVKVPLEMIGNGIFEMELVADGPDETDFVVTRRQRNATDEQQVRMLPYGGFAMRLTPQR